jgi:hypothetical protein
MKNEKNEELKNKAIINMYMAVDDIRNNLLYIFKNKIDMKIEPELDNKINTMFNSFIEVADAINNEIARFGQLRGLEIIDPVNIDSDDNVFEITLENQNEFLQYVVVRLEVESSNLREAIDFLETKEDCQDLKVLMYESAGNILHNIVKIRSEMVNLLLF